MKYCTHCGGEVHEFAVMCPQCGYSIQAPVAASSSNSGALAIVIKIFMIIGCVTKGFLFLPLAWCIPMTISVFSSLNQGRPISLSMKICTLLFVNTVAGICMLCMDDE